jgi:hypothetical protein
MRQLKHILFIFMISMFIILIEAYSKPSIYFDIAYANEKKGPAQIFFAENAQDFKKENSKTEAINIFGDVYFPFEKSTLLKINFLRFDVCSCEGSFQINDWGITRGFNKVSLPVDKFSPFYQVVMKNNTYISTGFDPQMHSSFLNFSSIYQVLIKKNFSNYLLIFFASIALYLIILFGYKKFTMWRFVFLFPLLFTVVLYFELKNGWQYLLFTYKQEALGEAVQAVLILFAAIISFYIFYKVNKNKFIKILHLTISLILFFLFLEETSYLQRFFLYETPILIENLNYQNEVTIHNLAGVHERTHLLYKILGLYGTLSWLILYVPKINASRILSFFVLPKITSLYFFAIFLFYYFWNNQLNFKVLIPNVQESFELLLAIAILIYAIRNFNQIFKLEIQVLEK